MNQLFKKRPKYSLNIVHYIKRMKWRWASHIFCLTDRWTYKNTFWYLGHKKRKVVKKQTRWIYNIGKFIKYK